MERATNMITAYPFTISAWFNPARIILGQQTIVGVANSAVASGYYAVVMSGNKIGTISANTADVPNR